MALLDKVLGRDEKEEKLKKEIRSLELRKETVFTTIDVEIARLHRERSNVLLEAGMRAYDVWSKDKTQANLEEYWTRVQELEKFIGEQEMKKAEMGNRYDEEISLISSNLSSVKVITTSGVGKCPKCNAQVSAEDVFCMHCGNKLN